MPTVTINGIAYNSEHSITPRIGVKTRAVLRMADPITLPIAGATPFQINMTLPFAPVATRHSNLAGAYSQIERPGRAPLSVWNSPQLEQLSFECVIANDFAPGYADCEDKITTLRLLAALPTDVVFAYGNMTTGKRWKITDFSYETTMRDPINDYVLQATGQITLTESVQIATQIVPGIQQIKDIKPSTVNRTGGAGGGGRPPTTTPDDYDADAASRRVFGVGP